MEIVPLSPQLHMIKPTFFQMYLWRDGSELTLVDTGVPGSAPDLAAAFAELGYRTADLRRVVLTHYHHDHIGSAADLAGWGDVEVLAHHRDAPVVRGERPGAEPVLTEREREMFARIGADRAEAPPCAVDTELSDGDAIGFGGGARVIGTPGHTDGSIAVHLPAHGVLFTGDLVTHQPNGLILGPFNTDRARAKASFVELTQVPAETMCFGHGDPLTAAGPTWRALGERCRSGPDAVPDPLGQ